MGKLNERRKKHDQLSQRCKEEAQYLINNGSTVRATAKEIGVSKSTVHHDITKRLPIIDPALYIKAKDRLEQNSAERHIRGGMATKRKYNK